MGDGYDCSYEYGREKSSVLLPSIYFRVEKPENLYRTKFEQNGSCSMCGLKESF